VALIKTIVTNPQVEANLLHQVKTDLQSRFNTSHSVGITAYPIIGETNAHIELIQRANVKEDLSIYTSILGSINPSSQPTEINPFSKIWSPRISIALLDSLVKLGEYETAFIVLKKLAAIHQCDSQIYNSFIISLCRVEDPNPTRVRSAWIEMTKANVTPSQKAIRNRLRVLRTSNGGKIDLSVAAELKGVGDQIKELAVYRANSLSKKTKRSLQYTSEVFPSFKL